ncbi:MAG: EAL domain-containing protein [Mycobacteriales bacterium]
MTRRWCGRLLVLAIAYYGGARLGLSLAIYHSQVTPFWPPTGIAVVGLLLWGRSLWPAVAIAAFAVNAPLSHGLVAPGLISVGNALAPVVAVTLLRRLSFRPTMTQLRDVGALVTAGGLAMLVSATVGTGALLLDGLAVGRAVPVWLTWWTGDAMGAVIISPFLLCLHQQRLSPAPTLRRAVEATGLLALTAATATLGFQSAIGLRFLVFSALAVAAVRFQVRGAAPATLIASLAATRAAAEGIGPFTGIGETRAMLALQLFNACLVLTAYLLAGLTAERERAHDALARQGGELERLVADRTEELRRALDQLAQAQQIARMGSFDFDLDTGEGQWSDEVYRLLQLPLDSPISLDACLARCHAEERTQAQELLERLVVSGEPFTLDHRMRRADGSYRWLSSHAQAVYGEDGTITGVRGTVTDVDARKTAERRFQQLVEMAPDAMVLVNGDGVITQVNLQTATLFGYSKDELVGQHLEMLIPERYRAVHPHYRKNFVAHPTLRPMGAGLDLHARRRDGSEFPVEISLSPLETDEGTLISAAIRDVTDRKQQQDELAYRGLHDALTGLPNRVLLGDRLARAVAGLQRNPGRLTTVVFLDLDRFKWVNDSLGHDAGDTLLRTVADRLSHAVRPGDTVARFGGDEFVVLSEGLGSGSEAFAMAERLRVAVSAPVTLQEGHVVVPTLSVGLTTTADPKADPAALLRDADAAMYRAKEQGRDRTAFFAPEIHAEIRSRLATAGGLRDAIAQGQLCVHYQPILSLATNLPLGVEALVRWRHPERGLLAPDEFVGLAEETGQVGALDRAVILTACREFGQFLAEHPESSSLRLNVNISLRHLSSALLRSTLLQGLSEGGLRPGQLTVEVTESADLSGEQFSALLAMVKELGVKVAIDDFGTGFSALSRLHGLGVDAIKIDRSFVTDVHTSDHLQALVAAMTQLATALQATVVAEGVETGAQAKALRELGCVAGQGYLWSKPVPIDELGRWLDGPAPVPAQRPHQADLGLAPLRP